MTNEEFQQAVLGKFDAIDKRFEAIDKRFEDMDKRFEAIDKRFETMDKRFETMDKRFDAMDKRFETMDKRFDTMDKRFDSLETTVNAIKAQQQEHDGYIQALLHRTEELDAKFDGLLATTASKERVARIEKKIGSLDYRIKANEIDLELLQKAN